MRYMIIVKGTENSETETLPTTEQHVLMLDYHEQLVKAGVMLDGAGLRSSKYGKRFLFNDDGVTVVDGPFVETKELIAGFNIIQVASEAEAVEWVRRWPAAAMGGAFELELRRVFEDEDFGDAATPELIARDTELREQAAANAR